MDGTITYYSNLTLSLGRFVDLVCNDEQMYSFCEENMSKLNTPYPNYKLWMNP